MTHVGRPPLGRAVGRYRFGFKVGDSGDSGDSGDELREVSVAVVVRPHDSAGDGQVLVDGPGVLSSTRRFGNRPLSVARRPRDHVTQFIVSGAMSAVEKSDEVTELIHGLLTR